MITILLTCHIIVTVILAFVILLQSSEGGALGIGGSPTGMFRTQQGSNFLTRTTAILAVLFFSFAIAIAVLSARERSSISPPTLFEEGVPTLPLGEPSLPTNEDSVPIAE